ncbi:MAG: glycine cleavage system aminomethyltransferase GcvT [Alphaproteobacteria bacterium]|nr:glycine cleavage system aminomethyltransferase GcvT [Alphaproteobacteria bacterium]MCB9984291.1 glycine cleavage system aminomethyltransferase GcvT [Micavibrio sp.]HRK97135.1 glycine cleavage system aminomethyltransferase GcvT [Alphaproteobacteria bacterium]
MKLTSLHGNHLKLNARMGEFAGYDMPLYYDLGVLKEHEWVREHAGLFDVSHMGQISLKGKGAQDLLQKLTPSSFEKLGINRAKYTVLLNEQGGIIDDLMVTKIGEDEFHMVINAGCKNKDIAWLKDNLTDGLIFTYFEDWALMALQGPQSEAVIKDVLGIDVSDLPYMGLWYKDYTMFISRLGYTGEDGFELSVPNEAASPLWDRLLTDDRVQPIGLAARDSLRLEMGYCLYGHDIDANTTPTEADLSWIMSKQAKEQASPPTRKRVGIVLTDKGIAREGAQVKTKSGEIIGTLTSGGYSPTLKQSIGQAYLPIEWTMTDTEIDVDVRGKLISAKVTPMPFLKPKTKGKV